MHLAPADLPRWIAFDLRWRSRVLGANGSLTSRESPDALSGMFRRVALDGRVKESSARCPPALRRDRKI